MGSDVGAGVGAGVDASTLGGIACILKVVVCVGFRDGSLVVFILRNYVSSCELSGYATGNISICFRLFTIFNSAFLVGYPTSRIGAVGVGGAARLLRIYYATYLKKSSVFTFGNEMTFGKKFTVSMSLTALVLLKCIFIHL